MGAVVIGNIIYISKDLESIISPRERKVLLAHEISHWAHKDSIKMLLIRPLSCIIPPLASYIRRRLEIRADREAIKKTRDISAFQSLLNKLNREGPNYPSKQFSLNMANNMAGKI